MLLRNIIEIIILLGLIIVGFVVFICTKKNAANYESDLILRKKEDIKGNITGEKHIDQTNE